MGSPSSRSTRDIIGRRWSTSADRRSPLKLSASFSDRFRSKQVESKTLNDYFNGKEPGYLYTDNDCYEIANYLKANQSIAWAHIPRIYVVLRILGRVQDIEEFILLGLNDLCLPFGSVSQLPRSLPLTLRERFLEAQNAVLTKSIELEKNGSEKRHVHFSKNEPFPYEVKGQLGSGRYAIVDEVLSPLSAERFARKRFRRIKGGSHSKSEFRSFMNELQVLKKIRHQHCIELIASYTETGWFGLLMSPVAECDLNDYILLAEQSKDHRKILCTFFGCLANAILYLHSNKIRHRDIKPANILVKGPTVYLADFGISLDWEHLSRSTTTEDSAKTLMYCAPEVAAEFQKRNSSSDIWSLGCVFLEMLTVVKGFSINDLRIAFRSNSETRAFYKNVRIAHGWLYTKLHDSVPKHQKTVAQWTLSMLLEDPDARPKAITLSHGLGSYKANGVDAPNPYCGECCVLEDDCDSEAARNDDCWDQDDIDTPATSAEGSWNDPRLWQPSLSATRPESNSFTSVPITKDRIAAEDLPDHETELQSLLNSHTSNVVSRAEKNKFRNSPTHNGSLSSHCTLPAELSPLLSSIKYNWWPFVDLSDILPQLQSCHWEEPVLLLSAIVSDVYFMSALQRSNPRQYYLFESANEYDILPLLHLLLLNGFHPFAAEPTLESAKTLTSPFSCVLGAEWDECPNRNDIAKLLVVFNHHRALDTRTGYGPIIHCVRYSNAELLETILGIGGDPDEADSLRRPALWHAASVGNNDAVLLLLDYGSKKLDYWTECTSGNHFHSPVVEAASKGHLKTVRILDARGCCHDPKTSIKATTLHVSACNGHSDIVEYLCMSRQYAKLLELKDKWGNTALMLAVYKGHEQIVRFLIQVGAACGDRVRNDAGWTPMTLAAHNGNLPLIETLAKAGVDPQRSAREGKNAFGIARARQHLAVEEYLKAHEVGRSLGLLQNIVQEHKLTSGAENVAPEGDFIMSEMLEQIEEMQNMVAGMSD